MAELRAARRELDGPVGLVPTMGTLHEGHLSLVRLARSECDAVGVSIFVNPTQFGSDEDLDSYPADIERDLELLEHERADLVWAPTLDVMYGPDFQTWVEVDQLTRVLEGERRPDHFRGVTTVIAKLFNAFLPDRAYFGQKDAQQVAVIRRMVRDLDFPIEIAVGPTVREQDGLAMSSRNLYMSPAERQAAPVLFRALSAAAEAYEAGARQAAALRETMTDTLAAEPLARPQYVSVADPESLAELTGSVDEALLSMAVYIGETRLIDNVAVGAG